MSINLLHGLSSKMEMVEERVSELKHKSEVSSNLGHPYQERMCICSITLAKSTVHCMKRGHRASDWQINMVST